MTEEEDMKVGNLFTVPWFSKSYRIDAIVDGFIVSNQYPLPIKAGVQGMDLKSFEKYARLLRLGGA
jgi:hypothetical protein